MIMINLFEISKITFSYWINTKNNLILAHNGMRQISLHVLNKFNFERMTICLLRCIQRKNYNSSNKNN